MELYIVLKDIVVIVFKSFHFGIPWEGLTAICTLGLLVCAIGALKQIKIYSKQLETMQKQTNISQENIDLLIKNVENQKIQRSVESANIYRNQVTLPLIKLEANVIDNKMEIKQALVEPTLIYEKRCTNLKPKDILHKTKESNTNEINDIIDKYLFSNPGNPETLILLHKAFNTMNLISKSVLNEIEDSSTSFDLFGLMFCKSVINLQNLIRFFGNSYSEIGELYEKWYPEFCEEVTFTQD